MSHPTPHPEGRRSLPLATLPMSGLTHGRRSAVTCHLKCDNACAKPAPNQTQHETFAEVATRLSRRNLIKGASAVAFLGAGAFTLTAAADPSTAGPSHAGRSRTPARPNYGNAAKPAPGASFNFSPINPVAADIDALTVPEGFRQHVIIRWGDPLFKGLSTFDASNQNAQRQARSFGYNNDYLDIFELNGGKRPATKGILACNHEYTNNGIMFAADPTPERHLENLRVSMEAVGFSVVDIKRKQREGLWRPVLNGKHNRRITATTAFAVDGPARGSELLQTQADPEGIRIIGTFANCSGGTTPWGTVLSGEENFNGYFRAAETERNARYGLNLAGSKYEWDLIEDRFDATLAGYENEPNRFGYIIEIDPLEPWAEPVKHTAMGRFKHEGANVHIDASGHAVAYMGDDERFDYVYKFVSAEKFRSNDRAHNKTLLSEGDLYVARFGGDADTPTGEWLPLIKNGESQIPGMSVAEVCVYTRVAADTLAPTKMDRPEDVDINPHTGKIYIACTNNSKRTADQVNLPNPRPANKNGHIIEITETDDRTRFEWTLLLVCGDETEARIHLGGVEVPVAPLSCPDNLAFDSEGHLWISTDGQPGTRQVSDGLFRVYLEGERRGSIEQFLAVPKGAETCGPVIHDRDGSVFVAVQHPGEDGSFEQPDSLWPDQVSGRARAGEFRGPRPSVVQVKR